MLLALKRCLASFHSSRLAHKLVCRWYTAKHSGGNPALCHQLTKRGVVRVAGMDSNSFLQGLITNDMNCLHGDCELQAMYAMMLNIQGRVLHDLILYNISKKVDESVFLLECDINGVEDLVKLLKRYKIRKKVDISSVTDELIPWAVFPSSPDTDDSTYTNSTPCSGALEDQYRVQIKDYFLNSVIVNTPDPRLRTFARRVILPPDVSASDVVENSELVSESAYCQRRYELGIGEGYIDMPPGASIPLENNAVFLNGVSFQKGCYIGQELTARTHHTGVIRKRLMPFEITSSSNEAQPGDKIETMNGKNAGKLRNTVNNYGLALLRIADVVGQDSLRVVNTDNDTVAEGFTWIPTWWQKADEIVKQVVSELSQERK